MSALDTLDIVMTFAAQEAVASGYAEITPVHLLIALSLTTEAGVRLATPADTTMIQREFVALGIEPRRFRHRLRELLGHGAAQHQGGPIHRSPTCKAVFSYAKQIAMAEDVRCHASHLVRAAFVLLCIDGGAGGTEEATGAVVPPDDDIPDAL